MHYFRLCGGIVASAVLMAQAPTAPSAGAAAQAPQPVQPIREPGLYATFHTTKGNIVAKLFPEEAPITVKNFMDLALGRKAWKHPGTGVVAKRPLYSGTVFHRVIPEFMVQGGDPLGTGFGGTENIPDEFHPTLKFDIPGRLAMANAGPNTGSSQFFLTDAPTPHLNGLHTIFGQVVQGQEFIGEITRVARDGNDKPRTPVILQRVTFETIGADGKPVVAAKKVAPAAKKTTPARKTTTPAAKKTTTSVKPAVKKAAPGTKPSTPAQKTP
jgi:peptidyl-prolyl cis-trans isomerase A (cyclophilin A)